MTHNLYRLDFLNDDGSVHEPVMDTVLRGDYLARHFVTAVDRAVRASELRPVAITRITGGGQLRRTAVVTDGKLARAKRAAA